MWRCSAQVIYPWPLRPDTDLACARCATVPHAITRSPLPLAAAARTRRVRPRSRPARAVRAALEKLPDLISVAQLGSRLRVLLSRSVTDPQGTVRSVLAGAGADRSGGVEARSIEANLEDVFVIATRRDHPGSAAEAVSS